MRSRNGSEKRRMIFLVFGGPDDKDFAAEKGMKRRVYSDDVHGKRGI